jgi:Tol biopolymer transport system component
MKVEIDGDHTPQLLLKGSGGRISPTERWVAIASATTGTDEIYVLPFPDTSRARTRISTDGGLNPTWAPDGKTLYYRRGQAVMAVSVGGDDPSTWPKPTMLFEGPYQFDTGPTHYDAARDGRLLMVKPVADDDGGARQLVVVQHWFEELRRLAPLK